MVEPSVYEQRISKGRKMAELRRCLRAAIPDMVDDDDISEGIFSPLIRLMEGTSGATGEGAGRVAEDGHPDPDPLSGLRELAKETGAWVPRTL